MNQLPRIAFAHYSRSGDIGGVTTWLKALACRLHEEGIPVAVHLHHEGSNPAHSSLAAELGSAGIETFCLAKQASCTDDVRSTLDFLNKWQPTVFLPQCLPAHFIAAAVAGRKGLPWALTVHSDDPQYWSALSVLRPTRNGDQTVCVSQNLASEVQRRGFDPDPLVIPCGVPLPPRRVTRSEAIFRVAYCGRVMEHQKRISLVLESLILACRQNPRMAATIIGDGPSLADLRHRVEAADLNEAIGFSGKVDPVSVPSLLAECQAILMMSDFEGLPVALMEAMAQGIVPVARAIPSGIPELVRHERTGLLVSEDPGEAAKALLRLAEDPELWHRCSNGAWELIHREYSEASTTARWKQLLMRMGEKSTTRYPIRASFLPFSANLAATEIDIRWKAPGRIRSFTQGLRTASAQLKHRLKQSLPQSRLSPPQH